ncbi:MAG: ABC transporter ATP-binding protein [Ginsengibacter sp.]
MKPILEIQNISKQFNLGERPEGYLALRDVFAGVFKKKVPRKQGFLALDDVSCNINPGESVGIIGRNGAGKSTLLKILSKITPPTSGKIVCRGRIASLLEVGTGFHPELSGRENIYMNGSILGMRKKEIDNHFDDIISFSGVENFIDTPLKRYSSGMQLRLAFAVAAHLEPEILIIDEVLAVGDAEFQKKCLGKMNDISKSGRTVIFVSHDLGAVQNLCPKSILLDKGKVIMKGSTAEVIDHYLSNNQLNTVWSQVKNLDTPHFARIEGCLVGAQPCMTLKINFTVTSAVAMLPSFVAFDISNKRGNVIGQAIPEIKPFISLNNETKEYTIKVALDGFVPNDYVVSAWMGSHNSSTYDLQKEVIGFSVTDSPQKGRVYPHTPDHGSLVLTSELSSVGKNYYHLKAGNDQ